MPPYKRLIIACDGTWVNSNDGFIRNYWPPGSASEKLAIPSNITRLCRALLPESRDGVEQIVFYQSGVGSTGGLFGHLGGLLGHGLGENIRQAYTFICNASLTHKRLLLVPQADTNSRTTKRAMRFSWSASRAEPLSLEASGLSLPALASSPGADLGPSTLYLKTGRTKTFPGTGQSSKPTPGLSVIVQSSGKEVDITGTHLLMPDYRALQSPPSRLSAFSTRSALWECRRLNWLGSPFTFIRTANMLSPILKCRQMSSTPFRPWLWTREEHHFRRLSGNHPNRTRAPFCEG